MYLDTSWMPERENLDVIMLTGEQCCTPNLTSIKHRNAGNRGHTVVILSRLHSLPFASMFDVT